MAKTDLMGRRDMQFAEQMLMFKNNIGKYAAILGLTPAQVAAQAADADYYNYVVLNHGTVLNHAKGWTALKKSLRRSNGSTEVTEMPDLVLPAPVPAVAPGVEQRFRALVRRIKLNVNYTLTIGAMLGIEAMSRSAPDYVTIQPKISAVVSGDHVELGWDWQGYRAFLDLCEFQVDRSDGMGFVPLTHSTVPGSVDKTPFPAVTVPWRYRAIYHANNARVGQWSQIASVAVPP